MRIRDEQTLPRYVELVRVSSIGQAKKDTAERQRHELDQCRSRQPGTLVERIEASGVSGTLPLAESREGRRLIELAGKFDELRVVHVSRVFGARSGDPGDQVAVASLCYKAGAVIATTEGRRFDPRNHIDMIQLAIECGIASKDRSDHLTKTNQGRMNAVRMGRSPGGGMPYYGRRFVKATGQWEFVDEQRKIFGEIVASVFEGAAAHEICRRLNARGVSTVTGKGKWYPRTLLRFLRARHLIGESEVTNKHCPNEVAILRLPPLLTEAEFNRLQQALDGRRPVGRPSKSGIAPLCGGRIFCACGARMYYRNKKQTTYYQCSSGHSDARTIRGQAKCPHWRSHRAEHVDAAVWEATLSYVNGDVLGDAANDQPDVGNYREEVARCDQLLANLVVHEKEVNAARRRRKMSHEAWLSELDSISTNRKTLERTRRVALETVARFEAVTVSRQSLRDAVAALRDRVRTASLEDRRALLQALIPNQTGCGIVIDRDGQITINAGVLDAAAGQAGSQGGGNAGDKVCRSSCRARCETVALVAQARRGDGPPGAASGRSARLGAREARGRGRRRGGGGLPRSSPRPRRRRYRVEVDARRSRTDARSGGLPRSTSA